MESESQEGGGATSGPEETLKLEETVYDCVICGQETPSTDERPVGLVAFLQATSGESY